jgi:integrase
MAVYKRGNTWWYKFTWRGEPIRESTKQTNKRVAEQMEAARKTGLAKEEVGIVTRKTAPTLKAFAPDFTAEIETKCAAKPATVSFYKSKLDQLLKYQPLASKKLDAIDSHTIDLFKQFRTKAKSNRNKPLAVASVNRELATLRRLLRLAHDWKIIASVPKIELLGGEAQREFVLSHETEPLYLASLNGELRDIAVFLIDTGLRIRECLTLEWPAVHVEPIGAATYGYLLVRRAHSKNSKPRNVPLTARVVEMLRARNGTAGLVFGKSDGAPLSQTNLNKEHVAARELLKLPVDFVPHSLRHTFGTRLGESGADAFTIMKLMGHSTLAVSQRYVHPSPETVERVFRNMEALNLSRKLGVGTELGTVDFGSGAKPQ